MTDKAIEAAAKHIQPLLANNWQLALAATRTIVLEYEAAKWRDIHADGNELPENMFFLVKTKDGNVLHSKEFATLSAKDAMKLLDNCTHWQPLPKGGDDA